MVNEIILPVPVLIIQEINTPSDKLIQILTQLGYPEILIMKAKDIAQAQKILDLHLPNLIFIDLQLPWALEFIQYAKNIHQDCQMIILKDLEQPEIIFKAIRAGALAYLSKKQSDDEWLENIKTIIRGGAIISPHFAQFLLNYSCFSSKVENSFQLSKNEYKIISLFAEHQSIMQISNLLHVSNYNIQTQIKYLYCRIANFKNFPCAL